MRQTYTLVVHRNESLRLQAGQLAGEDNRQRCPCSAAKRAKLTPSCTRRKPSIIVSPIANRASIVSLNSSTGGAAADALDVAWVPVCGCPSALRIGRLPIHRTQVAVCARANAQVVFITPVEQIVPAGKAAASRPCASRRQPPVPNWTLRNVDSRRPPSVDGRSYWSAATSSSGAQPCRFDPVVQGRVGFDDQAVQAQVFRLQCQACARCRPTLAGCWGNPKMKSRLMLSKPAWRAAEKARYTSSTAWIRPRNCQFVRLEALDAHAQAVDAQVTQYGELGPIDRAGIGFAGDLARPAPRRNCCESPQTAGPGGSPQARSACRRPQRCW